MLIFTLKTVCKTWDQLGRLFSWVILSWFDAKQPGTEVRTEYQPLESHFGFASPISTLPAGAMPVPVTFLVPGVFCLYRSKVYFGSGFKPRGTKTEEILLG